MSKGPTILIAVGIALWVVFVMVSVYVATEIAADRNRDPLMWGAFAFLFPGSGPVLVWLLPQRQIDLELE